MADLPTGEYDVVLANPPYFANSEVGRHFILTARDVLRPGGRFYFVTKMPVQTIPEIVETFGNVVLRHEAADYDRAYSLRQSS